LSQQPPDFLDYDRRDSRGRAKRPAGRFRGLSVLAGVLAGGALSGAVWPLVFWKPTGEDWFWGSIAGVLAIKLIAGIGLSVSPSRARFFGIGLLLSIILGALIFFCTCGASFSSALRH